MLCYFIWPRTINSFNSTHALTSLMFLITFICLYVFSITLMLVNMFVFNVNKPVNSCNTFVNYHHNKLDLILTSSLFKQQHQQWLYSLSILGPHRKNTRFVMASKWYCARTTTVAVFGIFAGIFAVILWHFSLQTEQPKLVLDKWHYKIR